MMIRKFSSNRILPKRDDEMLGPELEAMMEEMSMWCGEGFGIYGGN